MRERRGVNEGEVEELMRERRGVNEGEGEVDKVR